MSSAKIAVSLPEETLVQLDRARRRIRVSRSAAVTQAIEGWLAARASSEVDRKYAEAYLRQPEHVEEIAPTAGAAAATWEPWE